MDYVILWFILYNGSGYIEPQKVTKTEMSCGLDGSVVGVQLVGEQVNTEGLQINPYRVRWPDPGMADKHCIVDIHQRVSTLSPGKYHIATTIVGDGTTVPYIGHDPHTTVDFMVIKSTVATPRDLKLKGQQ
jgi:hypothetical protein